MENRQLARNALTWLALLVLGVAFGAAEPALASAPIGDAPSAWADAALAERRAFEDPDADPVALTRDLREAARVFLHVAESPGGNTNGYWRAARAEWLAGEFLPLDADDERVARFERARDLAQRGIDADPDCGECMLWKFSAVGRVATTRGLLSSARSAREMGRLLDRGIELRPTHTDGAGNSSLGNLYYASAVFYRIVPDSLWMKWLFGVRGDKAKALAHSRRALELHPSRLDYRVEVGTQLLCIGTLKNDAIRLDEGKVILAGVSGRLGANEDERREIDFAGQLLSDPDKACGYTGDRIVDLDSEEKKARQ